MTEFTRRLIWVRRALATRKRNVTIGPNFVGLAPFFTPLGCPTGLAYERDVLTICFRKAEGGGGGGGEAAPQCHFPSNYRIILSRREIGMGLYGICRESLKTAFRTCMGHGGVGDFQQKSFGQQRGPSRGVWPVFRGFTLGFTQLWSILQAFTQYANPDRHMLVVRWVGVAEGRSHSLPRLPVGSELPEQPQNLALIRACRSFLCCVSHSQRCAA